MDLVSTSEIKLVAFDVAGTTMRDENLVISAFKIAFEATQPDLWPTKSSEWTKYALDTMGQSKIKVFTEILGNRDEAIKANTAFEEAYLDEVVENGASPIEGAEDLFKWLRNKEIKIALTTGFSRSTMDELLRQLNWSDLIDISVTPSEVNQGRPSPEMLQFALKELEVASPLNVLVVGDTAADMESGHNFGAVQIVGVLSGAHDEQTLLNAGATSVINSVADLSSLI